MLLIPVPALLVSVTVFAALVEPTACDANVRLAGEKVRGKAAVPETL
jgi:hypothetical protein